jgi:hypothetical protein
VAIAWLKINNISPHVAWWIAMKNDYLLFTPFRYPPLLNGTRFGTAAERSPFYGARELETAFAEMAHMRFQFMADTTALLPSLSLRYTSFAFAAQASAALDLTQAPFAAHHPHILHPDDYIHSQELGTQMRQDNIEFCLFHSVRHETGVNICIFTPSVFTGKSTKHQHWVCFSDRSSVTFSKDKKVYYRFKAQDVYSK